MVAVVCVYKLLVAFVINKRLHAAAKPTTALIFLILNHKVLPLTIHVFLLGQS